MFRVIKIKRIIVWIVILIFIFNIGNILRVFYPAKYIEHVKNYSKEFAIDPYLVLSIIKAESKFEQAAVSHKNAKGLMQITEPTAEWIAQKLSMSDFKMEQITDPGTNIKMGCYYISYLLDMYDGNVKNALAAYNAGFNVVNRWLEDNKCSKDGENLSYIPYGETDRYIVKVLNNHKMYQFIYKIKT